MTHGFDQDPAQGPGAMGVSALEPTSEPRAAQTAANGASMVLFAAAAGAGTLCVVLTLFTAAFAT